MDDTPKPPGQVTYDPAALWSDLADDRASLRAGLTGGARTPEEADDLLRDYTETIARLAFDRAREDFDRLAAHLFQRQSDVEATAKKLRADADQMDKEIHEVGFQLDAAKKNAAEASKALADLIGALGCDGLPEAMAEAKSIRETLERWRKGAPPEGGLASEVDRLRFHAGTLEETVRMLRTERNLLKAEAQERRAAGE